MLVAVLLSRRDVSDWRVEPNVPIISRRIRNLESEVGRWSRHIPVSQRLAEKVALQVVCDFRLEMIAALSPLVEELV